MPPRPPPRFVVYSHDQASQRRRRLWLLVGWPVSLVAVALSMLLIPQQAPVIRTHLAQVKQLSAENEHLKQQVADLQRSQQVNDIAMRSLHGTLSEREEQISGLRADLGFYSRLVGGDGQREGLKVQEVRVQPVPESSAWNLTLSLTQNVRRGDEINGKAIVTVEGLRGDKVVQLNWPALGDTAQKDGVPFHFKYFQQLHCTLVLPADFRPMRVRIQAKPDHGDDATRSVVWSDALNGNITTQGDHDAQP